VRSGQFFSLWRNYLPKLHASDYIPSHRRRCWETSRRSLDVESSPRSRLAELMGAPVQWGFPEGICKRFLADAIKLRQEKQSRAGANNRPPTRPKTQRETTAEKQKRHENKMQGTGVAAHHRRQSKPATPCTCRQAVHQTKPARVAAAVGVSVLPICLCRPTPIPLPPSPLPLPATAARRATPGSRG